MATLVQHLRREFGAKLPAVANLRDVRDVVCRAMMKPASGTWRPLKADVAKILTRALAFARTDGSVAAHLESESECLQHMLLASLAVAWSYCTKETFDSRLPGANHRERQVYNGHALEDPTDCPPALLRYHQVQFQLLWWSNQLNCLDFNSLEELHQGRQCVRDAVMDYFRGFKKLSLAQWGRLDAVLSKVLAGSAWDSESALVDTAAP